MSVTEIKENLHHVLLGYIKNRLDVIVMIICPDLQRMEVNHTFCDRKVTTSA